MYVPPQHDQDEGRIRDGHVNVTPAAEEAGEAGQQYDADRPELLEAGGDDRARPAAGYVGD